MAHTVQSMQCGTELGWTTVIANRTSVKAILRELRVARVAGRLEGDEEQFQSNAKPLTISTNNYQYISQHFSPPFPDCRSALSHSQLKLSLDQCFRRMAS